EETYVIIYGVLAVTAITELLFTRGFWLRFSFQCLTIVGVIIWKLPNEWAGWPEGWLVWDSVRPFLVFHIGQLDPFFQLALGVLLAVHILSWIGQSRTGAIFVVVLSVLVLATI